MITLVILLFLDPRPAVAQRDPQPARHLRGKLAAKSVQRPHHHFPQQFLHVAALDPLRTELLRRHLTVEQHHRHEIRQTVIGLLLGADQGLVTLLAAADDVVRRVKGVDLDPGDLRRLELVPPAKPQAASKADWK